jgi:hypothetical protein
MTNKTNTNRRQYYRYEPPTLDAPVLSLLHDGRRCRAVSVIDVNLKGVRLVFAADALPPLLAGTVVTTSLQAPDGGASTDIAGRIVFSFERGEHCMVAIAFSSTPDLGDGMTADFFRVFNRRADLRRNLPPGSKQVSALVLNAAGEADAIIDLVLRDHSDQGIGFVVDTRTDAYMRDGASLALPLPDRLQAVWPAQIRRRDAHAGAIHYGCTFDGKQS